MSIRQRREHRRRAVQSIRDARKRSPKEPRAVRPWNPDARVVSRRERIRLRYGWRISGIQVLAPAGQDTGG